MLCQIYLGLDRVADSPLAADWHDVSRTRTAAWFSELKMGLSHLCEIDGLGGGVFNTPAPVSGDPETTLTGLSRAEHQQLERVIRADIDEAFRNSGIPLLSSSGAPSEVRPSLTVHIRWARVKPDTITVQVRIDLLEAARLVKDPSRIVFL